MQVSPIYFSIVKVASKCFSHPWITWQDILAWSPFCSTHPLDIPSNNPYTTSHICLQSYFHEQHKATCRGQAVLILCSGVINICFHQMGVQRYLVVECGLQKCQPFLQGFCDPLGINNSHALSSNFQIFLALCKCGRKTQICLLS